MVEGLAALPICVVGADQCAETAMIARGRSRDCASVCHASPDGPESSASMGDPCETKTVGKRILPWDVGGVKHLLKCANYLNDCKKDTTGVTEPAQSNSGSASALIAGILGYR